mgnify:CR=1 FL=1
MPLTRGCLDLRGWHVWLGAAARCSRWPAWCFSASRNDCEIARGVVCSPVATAVGSRAPPLSLLELSADSKCKCRHGQKTEATHMRVGIERCQLWRIRANSCVPNAADHMSGSLFAGDRDTVGTAIKAGAACLHDRFRYRGRHSVSFYSTEAATHTARSCVVCVW